MLRPRPTRASLALGIVLLSGCGRFAPVSPAAPSSGDTAGGAHEVDSRGVRLWYRVAGRGREGAPPVVFLHGGPGQGSVHFDALAGPRLEPSLRMVYFDQRGSGRSERPTSGDYAIPTLVADIERLREHLGVERLALAGHSFGGTLALEYAAAHPERVAGLVFVAGLWDTPFQCRLRLERVGEVDPGAFARVRADTLAPDGTRVSDCVLESRAFPSSEAREAYTLGSMFPDAAVSARIDSVNQAHGVRNTGDMSRALFSSGLLRYRFSRFDRLTMPVLIIGGGRDGAARPAGLRELAGRLPNARYVEYARSGHFVYLDEPQRFARDLTRFVATLRR